MNKKRIYNSTIPIIGLTGSIATGKSTFSSILIKNNYPVICADQLVKRIYKKDSSKDFLQKINPLFTTKKEIDFKLLRESFFHDAKLKARIEKFIYDKLEDEFKTSVARFDSNYVIYDVPLLFEKKIENTVDSIILVHSSKSHQLERLIKRDNISKEMALKMIKSQISTKDKAPKADLIINNEKQKSNLDDEYHKKFVPFIKSFLKKSSSDHLS